jgi:hypothetical protein
MGLLGADTGDGCTCAEACMARWRSLAALTVRDAMLSCHQVEQACTSRPASDDGTTIGGMRERDSVNSVVEHACTIDVLYWHAVGM